MSSPSFASLAGTPMHGPSAILIVEDEGIVARDLQERLVGLGYDAYATAASATQAMARAGEKCPDLVLMDIRIKGAIDGVQTATALKEKYDTAIVYLTAHADQATIERAKLTEPHGYLRKPIEDELLRSTIEIALYRHKLEQTREYAAKLEARQLEELLRMSRALRESDENFRRMVAAVTDYAIFMLDANGHVISWNEGAQRLKGYDETEIIGKHFSTFYSADDVAHGKPDRELGDAARLGRIEAEGWRVRKDGTRFFADVMITAVRDTKGELRGFSKIIRDVTAKREIERFRSEFVSIVSHELRTPLTSIKGSLGLLRAGLLGHLPEEAASMVQIAYNNSERLGRIIDDILDMAKIESGELSLHMAGVGVADLVRQAMEANAAFADTWRVRFILGELSDDASTSKVFADADRLMQVLANLLSNAAKFSSEGSAVLIRVITSADAVRIEVQDSGPGVAETFRGKIFEKFAQSGAPSAHHAIGTGLGLSIAKALMEAMGGTIGFSSVEGHGSTFFVELPRLEAMPLAIAGAE